jgi:hypothetical protein
MAKQSLMLRKKNFMTRSTEARLADLNAEMGGYDKVDMSGTMLVVAEAMTVDMSVTKILVIIWKKYFGTLDQRC